MHSNATYRGRANILKRPNRLNVRSGSVAGPPPVTGTPTPPQPDLPRGAYWSPKNLRTRADLRARTRKNGSENTTWEMLPYRS